jgi:putative hydrolase of the HAD superfamily
MDGTLLDLHFDNHFWMELVPRKYAEQNGLHIDDAKQRLNQEFKQVHGTLNWYCLDFWSDKLSLDIRRAKREIQHLISMRDDTIPFLDALKQSGREVILLTNAHPDSLSLKVEHTYLDKHIDILLSTHEFGVSKEFLSLWEQIQQRLGFDAKRTLMVDDNVPILQTAERFGIGHLLAVENPDSQLAHNKVQAYPSTADYRDLIPDILANPVTQ